MNDQINTVLNRYEAFKKGDYAAAKNPVPEELSAQSSSAGLSLIDFDDSQPPTQTSPSTATDDLSELFGSSQPVQSSLPVQSNSMFMMRSGGPNMGMAQSTTISPTPVIGGMGTHANNLFGNTSTSPPAIMLPSTPANSGSPRNGTPGMSPPAANAGSYGGMGSGAMGQWGMGSNFGNIHQTQAPMQPPHYTSQQQQQVNPSRQQNSQMTGAAQPQTSASGKDPFADLAGLF